MSALVERCLQAVATRWVRRITEELAGHSFSSSSISRLVTKRDDELAKWAQLPLTRVFRYLILDARYERVRLDGCVRSQAVIIAVGVDQDGVHHILCNPLSLLRGVDAQVLDLHAIGQLACVEAGTLPLGTE